MENASKKVLERRHFLQWLAVAGIGGVSGLNFNLPQGIEGAAAEIPSEEDVHASVPKADKISFHVFSKHLQFLGYEAMAETAAEIGFDGVDLAVRPGGHVLPEKVAEDLPKAVAAMRKQGLQPAMMTTALPDASDATNRKVLKIASELGIGYYRTNWLWYDDQKSIKENFAHFKQTLDSLAKLNQELKIVGDYQNHAGFNGYPLGGPVWDLAVVLEEISNPFMGCQYDIRHATVEGATSWPLGLKRVRPHIHTLVVKDFKWGLLEDKWQIINTPIGEGMVDFRKFFSLLKELNISAPISVHYEYEMPEHQKDLSKSRIRQQTVQLMQKDLKALRGFAKEAGLG